MVLQLNQRSFELIQRSREQFDVLRVASHSTQTAELLDFGVMMPGGLDAGLLLARLCMADLADVSLVPRNPELPDVAQLMVRSDQPLAGCLGSQYAGWKVSTDDYFGMGSGAMRALAGSEDVIRELKLSEESNVAVGVLEAGSLPTESAITFIRSQLPSDAKLLLAVAPTASHAGNIQVVARSLETALHKLHELHFPLNTIISGSGIAPLPPVAKNDLHGIGRTNDAILYGATVTLWVRCDDEMIAEFGPKVPSCSSAMHGETFLSLFKAANHDFYAMDKDLFSPAVVVFQNLATGRSFKFGRLMPEVLKKSFAIESHD